MEQLTKAILDNKWYLAGATMTGCMAGIGIAYFIQKGEAGNPQFGIESWDKEIERVKKEFGKSWNDYKEGKMKDSSTEEKIIGLYALTSFVIENGYAFTLERDRKERLEVYRKGDIEQYLIHLKNYGEKVHKLFYEGLTETEDALGLPFKYAHSLIEKDPMLGNKKTFAQGMLIRAFRVLQLRYKNKLKNEGRLSFISKEKYCECLRSQIEYAKGDLPSFGGPRTSTPIRSNLLSDYVIDRLGIDLVYTNFDEYKEDPEVKFMLGELRKAIVEN